MELQEAPVKFQEDGATGGGSCQEDGATRGCCQDGGATGGSGERNFSQCFSIYGGRRSNKRIRGAEKRTGSESRIGDN